MMIQALKLLTLAGVVTTAITLAPVSESAGRLRRTQVGPCQLADTVTRNAARARLSNALTDTSSYFVQVRALAGLNGVTPQQIVVESDTVVCRQAINAFYAYYDSAGVQDTTAHSISEGLVLRAGSNRIILVVNIYDPWTRSRFTVFDSTFAVVLHYL